MTEGKNDIVKISDAKYHKKKSKKKSLIVVEQASKCKWVKLPWRDII